MNFQTVIAKLEDLQEDAKSHFTKDGTDDIFRADYKALDIAIKLLTNPSKYEQPKADDNVEHPQHYNSGGVECIDAMQITQGKEAVKSFCICNAFKYLWRHENKNGTEDIKKALWYLKEYVELEEG